MSWNYASSSTPASHEFVRRAGQDIAARSHRYRSDARRLCSGASGSLRRDCSRLHSGTGASRSSAWRKRESPVLRFGARRALSFAGPRPGGAARSDGRRRCQAGEHRYRRRDHRNRSRCGAMGRADCRQQVIRTMRCGLRQDSFPVRARWNGGWNVRPCKHGRRSGVRPERAADCRGALWRSQPLVGEAQHAETQTPELDGLAPYSDLEPGRKVRRHRNAGERAARLACLRQRRYAACLATRRRSSR